MRGKVCVITGASAGIGKETALGLAKRGAHVIAVARDPERGAAAVAEIHQRSGNLAVELMVADLAVQAAVRGLAEAIMARHDRLDVLINNAAVITPRRQLTADGIEMQLAVNHLAPFLLTHLLLDRLRASAPARVVTVSSQVESRGAINLANLQGERSYDHLRAYNQSKLANVLFTYELARRLAGSGVTANCLHPGVIATNLLADFMGRPRVAGALAGPGGYSGPDQGARTSIWLACEPSLVAVSGKYFRDQRESETSRPSYDRGLATRLWAASCALTGLPAD